MALPGPMQHLHDALDRLIGGHGIDGHGEEKDAGHGTIIANASSPAPERYTLRDMWRLLLPLFVCGLLAACTFPQLPNGEPTPVKTQENNLEAEQMVQLEAIPEEGTATGMILADIPHRMTESGLLEIGSKEARHTLLLFVTPGSPYSVAYVETLLPRVVRDFLGHGQLRIHVAFMPFSRYPKTVETTRTLLCAARTLKGTEVLSALVRSPDAYATAAPAGMTLKDLRACEGSAEIAALAALHASLARSLEVTQVPVTFLDGEKQVGLPEWTDLRAQLQRVIGVR